MKTICGIDVSIDISLFEYGIAWIESEKGYEMIYGICANENCEYDCFSKTYYSKTDIIQDEYDYLDLPAVAKCCGFEYDDWIKQDIPYLLCDINSYYGIYDTFGGPYFEMDKSDVLEYINKVTGV